MYILNKFMNNADDNRHFIFLTDT